MPKILENVRENLLQEAKKQVMEEGYSSMTIRSVASACGVGVGTVYNYFPSKDNLVANFMLEDWVVCRGKMQLACNESGTDVEKALRGIYEALQTFMGIYAAMFADEGAAKNFKASFQQRHKMLRGQIAEPLEPFCMEQSKAEPAFLAQFVAEAMLVWTMEGKRFEDIGSVLLQLF